MPVAYGHTLMTRGVMNMRNHISAQSLLLGVGLLLLAACSGVDSEAWSEPEPLASSQQGLSAEGEYLFFASDAHYHDSPSTPLANLQEVVGWAHNDLGISCERAALVGDSTPSASYLSTLRTQLASVSTNGDAIFTQGNHDCSQVAGNGPVAVSGNENYQLFTISWDQFPTYEDPMNNPLRTYLEARDFSVARNKVQFVLTHYPLHSSQFPDWNPAAQGILAVLQEFGRHIDLVVLWGHDHRHTDQDTGIPMIVKPGEVINIHGQDRRLDFAYLNAGYITPPTTPSNLQPTATVIGVDRHSIEIWRRNYDESTEHTSYTRRNRIALRAAYNQQYACADLNGNRNGQLYADRPAPGPWETFHMEDLGGGQVAFWAHSTARYVAAENCGTARAVANRFVIGYDHNGVSWEMFDKTNIGDGYSFRSHTNNQHLRYDSFQPANPNAGLGSKFYIEEAP